MGGADIPGHAGVTAMQRATFARLQRRIPVGQIDIDLPHLDPMLARIAHKLGRRVEAERLRVQHRGQEDVGVAAFQPARGIDQQRETRGVAFGKAIFAEAFDLPEAALGEFALVALGGQPRDHAVAERLNRTGAAKGRHRAAQLVGFRRRETGENGDLHRLFLKQRHTERLAQHRLQLARGEGDRLQPLPAAQIGMHHVALDRSGPHDGDLDHEIIELRRLQPRQHRHLRPALDLEHADRVGALDHRIDASLLRRHGREPERQSIMPVEQPEPFRQRRQHPQRQHVDLEQPERVEIVLVPLDRGAVVHRRVHDRRDLVEPVAGDDETAAVLRQMAGKAGDFLRHLQAQGEGGIARVQPGQLGARALFLSPAHRIQGDDDILGQAEHLGRLADRRAGAIGRHGAGQPRPLAPIFAVDVLDHLVAPLVLEIDVDVGRLVALGADETLEQEIEPRRIDLGDPQTEAHRRIGRRAAPLAQDSARARKAHDVVHGEEIGRVMQAFDQTQFMRQRLLDALRHAVGITLARTLVSVSRQRLLRRRITLAQLLGIDVREFVEREGQAVEKARALFDRLRRLGKQPRHFGRALEMALGIGLRQPPRAFQRHALADAGQHVGERAPLGDMHQRVVERQQRRVELARQRRAPREALAHVGSIGRAGADPQPVAERLAQDAERREIRLRQRDDLQAFAKLEQIGEIEPALALRRAQIAR